MPSDSSFQDQRVGIYTASKRLLLSVHHLSPSVPRGQPRTENRRSVDLTGPAGLNSSTSMVMDSLDDHVQKTKQLVNSTSMLLSGSVGSYLSSTSGRETAMSIFVRSMSPIAQLPRLQPEASVYVDGVSRSHELHGRPGVAARGARPHLRNGDDVSPRGRTKTPAVGRA